MTLHRIKNILISKNNFLLIEGLRYISKNKSISKTGMKPVLYYDEASPPARFVLMTAKYLNIDMTMKRIDLFKNENRKEDYRKAFSQAGIMTAGNIVVLIRCFLQSALMDLPLLSIRQVEINPLCKVPAMCVNNNTIFDSNAICLYLCQMYDDDTLYPVDEMIRARVHEMLFYHSSTLFPIDSAVFTEFFAGKKTIDDKYLKQWSAAMDFLELRLQNSKWLSDDTLRLSDLCCAATVSSLQILVAAEEKHQRVKKWLEKVSSHQSFHDINEKGLKRLQEFVKIIQKA